MRREVISSSQQGQDGRVWYAMRRWHAERIGTWETVEISGVTRTQTTRYKPHEH